jgi:integrase
MNFVQPIRGMRKLEAIKQHLRESNERDYILFMIGINTSLRISDILPLQVLHVEGAHIHLREQKTNKYKSIKINSTLRKELDKFIAGKAGEEYLFKSRNRKQISGLKDEPIDTSKPFLLDSSMKIISL